MTRRKMTEDEKRIRRHQRRAEKENAKVREQLPLFASQVPLRTAADEYWRWRRNVACGVEGLAASVGPAALALRTLEASYLARLAQAYLSPDQWNAVWAYRQRTYPPGPLWDCTVWRSVLVGRRIACGLQLSFDASCVTRWNPEGRKVTEINVVQLDNPPFTAQGLHAHLEVPAPMEAPAVGADLNWFLYPKG